VLPDRQTNRTLNDPESTSFQVCGPSMIKPWLTYVYSHDSAETLIT